MLSSIDGSAVRVSKVATMSRRAASSTGRGVGRWSSVARGAILPSSTLHSDFRICTEYDVNQADVNHGTRPNSKQCERETIEGGLSPV
jgi:hypothetical protein